MKVSLNTLYRAIGVSKQSVHQWLNRVVAWQDKTHQLLFLIHQLREEHPTMGCRDMYYYLQPDFMGRDAFEAFCRDNRLASDRPRNYRKTTNSKGVTRFPNLIIGLEITHLNQVWVSDITYYEVCGKFYYITFITDDFSRRIIGYHVSKRLFSEQTTMAALRMARATRRGMNIQGTIFHSDGGGQYYDDAFLKETERLGLYNSMCEFPWENGKAERVNGVIKNNYLKHRNINDFEQLVKSVDRSVKSYNQSKPHIALGRLSPVNFEKMYLSSGKTSEADKPAMENKTHDHKGMDSPSGRGKTSSASNTALDNNKNICLTVV